jgi:hypothetical protein
VIERLTGIGFIEDLSEFLLAFEGMAEGFRARAGHVRALLLGPEASFVLVAGPERESTEQAVQFLDRLEAFGVPLAGVVANRVRVWPGGGKAPERDFAAGDVDRLRDALAAQEGPDFPADVAARAAVDAAAGYAALVRRDERALGGLRERTLAVGRFWSRIPELPRDVHDLDGLDRIGRFLFERPKEAALGTGGQAEAGARRPA